MDVLLVDRNNYHKFQPLLYQVATAGLDVDDITQPIRHIVRGQANADVRLGLVVGADLDGRTLRLDDGAEIPYDTLVLAPGASTAYYGVEGAFEHAFPLKNVTDAVALRSHVLTQFERAALDPERVGEGALTIAVVGGGPTGVETAGAMRELAAVLAKDFPTLDADRFRVVLVDGADLPLAGYADDLRQYTREGLKDLGAEVRFGTNVARVTPRGVELESGERIAAETVVWAAGVRANPLADVLGVEQTKGGRIVVDETLRVPGHEAVFVIGDAAGATDPDGDLYPGVAQVAIQQGRHAARLIAARAKGEAADAPFAYRDLGQMATIGRSKAVLQTPAGLKLTGFLAWAGWLLVHLVKLVGFRNRLSVFTSWLYNYLTYDRGPRIILTQERGEPVRPTLAAAPTAAAGRGGSHDPVLDPAGAGRGNG